MQLEERILQLNELKISVSFIQLLITPPDWHCSLNSSQCIGIGRGVSMIDALVAAELDTTRLRTVSTPKYSTPSIRIRGKIQLEDL